MDQVDPHLEILLQEFVRLCPEDAPLEQDHWAWLYEICLFVHEQDIVCPALAIRQYFVQHGCSQRKATFLSHQYGHFLQILTLRDQRKPSSAKRLNGASDALWEEGP